jgi:hypothetical protein
MAVGCGTVVRFVKSA